MPNIPNYAKIQFSKTPQKDYETEKKIFFNFEIYAGRAFK